VSVTLGDDSQPMKVMFFGDSLISGVHNSQASVCPFRYDFLRGLKNEGKAVIVVGTNSDNEGACQKIGEELSLKHNGYLNAEIDELLDFIAADLQYLYDPVDYVFTSVGTQDCLSAAEGSDFQIISQSVRRIMGRLLNLNENGKIYHIPILLPGTAGKTAVECMDFVNQKLRDVYDPEKNHGRIRVIDPLDGKNLTEDMFYILGEKKPEKPKAVPEAAPVPAAPVPAAPVPAAPVPAAPVAAAPAAVAKPVAPAKPAVAPATPAAVPAVPAVSPPAPVTAQGAGETRRLKNTLQFLPKPELARSIAQKLASDLDWTFRAQTPPPTLEVTKEPDYYGYEWCKGKYEEDQCFEYYYGYVWCLQEYSESDCYSYYYGEVDEWKEEDSYKWCLNFYDEEYCSFAYQGNEPDTWDWLSFGYHDCLKSKNSDDCFERYYGYAWCVNEYTDTDCYEYYYGDEQWVWDNDANMKWCRNFYTEDECVTRYQGVTTTPRVSAKMAGMEGGPLEVGGTNNVIRAGAVLVVVGIAAWCCYKKLNCFGKTEYSRLDTRNAGAEDEVELL